MSRVIPTAVVIPSEAHAKRARSRGIAIFGKEGIVPHIVAILVAGVLAIAACAPSLAAQQVDSARAGVRRPPVSDTTKKVITDAAKKPATAGFFMCAAPPPVPVSHSNTSHLEITA